MKRRLLIGLEVEARSTITHRRALRLMMTFQQFACSFLLGLLAWPNAAIAQSPSPQTDITAATDFRIVGYLPDYRLATFDESTARLVTDLVVFSVEAEPSGTLNTRRLPVEQLRRLKQIKQRTRVNLLLCVGGWDRSTGFAALSANASTRQRFVQEAIRFCLDQRFDGVDIDWEHPANATEQQNYATLLQDLKARLSEHGLSVTVTLAAWQQLPTASFSVVDAVHVMAYDHDGRHSTFEGARRDVQSLLDRQVPSSKIVLGLPFYGRNLKDPNHASTYAEIVKKYSPAADEDEVDGIYFNGPRTISAKIDFARRSRLGGVMIWELGQDAPGSESLLRVVRNASFK